MMDDRRWTRKHLTGQATVELTVAMVLVLILLVASVKIFVWINERMVQRQLDYDCELSNEGRVAAANAVQTTGSINNLMNEEQTRGIEVNESAYPALNLFN